MFDCVYLTQEFYTYEDIISYLDRLLFSIPEICYNNLEFYLSLKWKRILRGDLAQWFSFLFFPHPFPAA